MKFVIVILGLLSVISLTAAEAFSEDRFPEFSVRCGVPAASKTQVFAANDGEHWKKYGSQEKIPEPNSEWAEGALLARGPRATATVIEGEGQDFSDSSRYCFDEHGNLSRIEREFTTAWGWGYSEEDSFKNGVLASHQEHFFDTRTKATIPRPAGADDVREAMKLKIYKSVKELPFFKLAVSDRQLATDH